MSFDTFFLTLMAILAVGYFLDKLGDAAKDIAKARLLEAEIRRDRDPPTPAADPGAPLPGLRGHRCGCQEDPPGSSF